MRGEVCVDCPIQEVCLPVANSLHRQGDFAQVTGESFDFDKSQKDILQRDSDAIIRCITLNPEDCVVMEAFRRIMERDIISANRENIRRNLN